MINVKELRIGNLIFLELGLPGLNVHTIKGQDIADIANGKVTLTSLTPIPLTPEWLERCGFANEPIGSNSYIKEDVKIFNFNDDGIYKMWNYKVEVKNVHQLQNLYFALTGEELTINNEHLQSTS